MSILRFAPEMARGAMPFWELEKMRDHMESIYNALAGGAMPGRNYSGVFPPINLSEDDANLYLTAEIPGASKEALDVSVKGDTLSLKGEIRREEAEGEEREYHRREREYGSFRRVLELPVKVDAGAVKAAFKNGVLTVTMPKAAEARAHQISIMAD